MVFISRSTEETEAIGEKFAKGLKHGDVIAFSGELGAGKTAFARGVLRGLGYTGRVTSPTFAITNEYKTPSGNVAHIDLYRVNDVSELYDIGFEEYFSGNRIVLIEWSENALELLPENYKNVCISYGKFENERKIQITQESETRDKACATHNSCFTKGGSK